MDIEDLKSKPFSELTTDEAIELLRQIRLSRRIPEKKKSTKKVKPTIIPDMSADQAKKLLEKIMEEN